jgi:hypothetical protein
MLAAERVGKRSHRCEALKVELPHLDRGAGRGLGDLIRSGSSLFDAPTREYDLRVVARELQCCFVSDTAVGAGDDDPDRSGMPSAVQVDLSAIARAPSGPSIRAGAHLIADSAG